MRLERGEASLLIVRGYVFSRDPIGVSAIFQIQIIRLTRMYNSQGYSNPLELDSSKFNPTPISH